MPPALQGVRLCSLDIGLMQAGASMKGEFEQRLRSVIDEVQGSPTPIILFIDEVHTLIGAGGQAGTGDAANLLKPALARGTLRTIGATTWSEYRQYIEKDPALTRRFQPVNVDEPSIDKATYMLRGILGPMEKHHKVRISDEAVQAAVSFSARYIPARQLPDKAVSLLDTACARVAISQSTTPAAIADLKVAIEARTKELQALERESELGREDDERVAELKAEIADTEAKLKATHEEYGKERSIVDEIMKLRASLSKAKVADGAPSGDQPAGASGAQSEAAAPDASPSSDGETRSALTGKLGELDAISPDSRMIYAHVDAQAVASVVADWTGIPVGRMVKDEVQTILHLAETLSKRVVGQDHGLEMIAKRIETNRAKLDNPNKPIGVFMLCGPSGVGKTETALALAEQLYGGEQNMITINMSEFQEAHTVSALKGAPPGYVGYGEGGRLTEAVRRKPYSVVLLDEVEKAHPDVHELFLPGLRQGLDGGRHRSADRLQEHADHPDVERRHRGHHEDGRRRPHAARQGHARHGAEALSDAGFPAGAARPHRDDPVFPVVGRHARRHRAVTAQPYQEAHRREPRCRFRIYRCGRRARRLAVQGPGCGWAHDRQHHHQHAAA